MSVENLTIVYRPVGDLKANPKNARDHSDDQVKLLAASIREFGFTNPVLLKGDGKTIGAGHGRWLGAKAAKLAEVPTITLDGLTDEQWRAYVIADNQLAITGSTWNMDILRGELGDLRSMGFDLSLTGFAALDLRNLFAPPGGGHTDPDDAPEPPAEPTSREGDLWILGEHRIICGSSTDATTVERVLAGARPQLMVTDPPYGVGYDPNWRNEATRPDGTKIGAKAVGKVLNDSRADWREAWALFPGAVAYVWHGDKQGPSMARQLEACGFEMRNQIIWNKSVMVIGRGHYHSKHEPCWYAVRKGENGNWQGGRKQTTIWDIEHRRSGSGHGTQKPVEAMRRPMENNSKPGDYVYEPFSGSGTSIIAAQMTGRRCLAIELSPAYVDVAVERWSAFTGEEPFHEDGRAFSDVKAERSAEEGV